MAVSKKSKVKTMKTPILFTHSHPNSIISDQFRAIRANVHFLTKEKTCKLFLITSPETGEGKSTTAANLAVSMAQKKEKILLIDANLRDPAIQDIFDISNNGGLIDILESEEPFEEVVHQTRIENLDILTCGSFSTHFGELLGNKKMKNLLAKLSACYNVVLIDSPSVLMSPETSLLSTYCDGVILILKRGNTKVEKIKEAKKVLDIAGAKIVGAVMNEK
ncbi:tyrosine protein kinase [Priestia aryabhattai]|uniref:CpsD/CapB family tyrosine-protein kinase n=1 Tax=Priestia TaxID=2800373 RepID=UPI000E12EB2A|nr:MULTISPECIES: CpsD/CapB family tyrosine-protein kinase [Priestia]MBY0007057.1 CpsD/CapB family tyrosine-protein kinase [Priestia aryabhattai]MBY0048561.1 CpsD/CapB family tyrosine-protein kinase [Priestia aryabhattai]NLR43276.1 CpsD/CapB family tyrosine-protein kinase [Priestia megaterium]SUV05491.1 capsular exopolysaccharide family [Priestia megaterium]